MVAASLIGSRLTSTAFGAHVLGAEPLLGESSPLRPRVCAPFQLQMPLVRILVRQFPKQRHNQLAKPSHTSSGLNLESTNGASATTADRFPLSIPAHIRIESISMVPTSTTKIPQMNASSRALKIRVCVSAIFDAAT